MSFTRLISFVLVSLNLFVLCSCTHLTEQDRSDLTPYQICNELNRRIMYYQHGINNEAEWRSPIERAKLLQDFQRFNCRNRLEHPND